MSESTSKRFTKFTVFVILVIVLLCVGLIYSINEESIQSILSSIPKSISTIIFVALYVGLTTFIWLGPKDIMRIVGAIFYGPYLSTVLVWIAETINAVILFNLSRRLGREYVESKLKGKTNLIDETINQSSLWWIFLMRVFVVPFRFLDLGCGLTSISLIKYLFIITVASPVRIFIFQYILSLGKDVYMNPDSLAEHLSAHPAIMFMAFAYMIGAFVAVFAFRKIGSNQQ